MKQKALRAGNAHSHEGEECRKRLCSARQCAEHSLSYNNADVAYASQKFFHIYRDNSFFCKYCKIIRNGNNRKLRSRSLEEKT